MFLFWTKSRVRIQPASFIAFSLALHCACCWCGAAAIFPLRHFLSVFQRFFHSDFKFFMFLFYFWTDFLFLFFFFFWGSALVFCALGLFTKEPGTSACMSVAIQWISPTRCPGSIKCSAGASRHQCWIVVPNRVHEVAVVRAVRRHRVLLRSPRLVVNWSRTCSLWSSYSNITNVWNPWTTRLPRPRQVVRTIVWTVKGSTSASGAATKDTSVTIIRTTW